jgi:hypothetical protein
MCGATRDVRFVPQADIQEDILRKKERPPCGGLSDFQTGVLI